jgi:eukaryotic-like serine/threonine-protein kinase
VRAIAEAHERGLVHRDVKPENIFVCDMGGERDFVKVLDFGIAKALGPAIDTALTREGVVVGTPAYMSPEQAMGREVDARSDVYALGCVLFYALTGSPPFEGPAARVLTAHAHEEAPRVGAYMPWEAPPELDALVERALAKKADERVGSMLELDRALAALPGLDAVERRVLSSPTPRALAETDLEVALSKSAG